MKVQERKISKTLPVKLTKEEIIIRGKELANATIDHRELDEERREVAKDYKGKISKIELDIRRLEQVVKSGKENREVECKESKDFVAGTYTLFRIDTGEVVEDRPLDPREKQLGMDGMLH